MLPDIGAIISLICFLSFAIATVVWGPLVMVTYQITETSVRIRKLGLPFHNIPFNEIRSCEAMPASKIWRPRVFFTRSPVMAHTRWFADGIMIRGEWRYYLLTPKNPAEFCQQINEHLVKAKQQPTFKVVRDN